MIDIDFEISKQQAAVFLNSDLEKIRMNLKVQMKLRGMTQENVGDIIGAEKSFISKILNKKDASPSLRTLSKLCRAVGLSLEQLVK